MEQNFENIVLPEAHKEELINVGAEAAEKHVDYIGRGIVKERRDVFREVLGERAAYNHGPGQSTSNVTQVSRDEETARIKVAEKSRQLQELVNIAAEKGPVEASAIVFKIGDPWLEDQFHDVMVKFHDELVRRGKLKEE